MTPAGLEPAIPGSVDQSLIHWATGPDECDSKTGVPFLMLMQIDRPESLANLWRKSLILLGAQRCISIALNLYASSFDLDLERSCRASLSYFARRTSDDLSSEMHHALSAQCARCLPHSALGRATFALGQRFGCAVCLMSRCIIRDALSDREVYRCRSYFRSPHA